jgi:hypothetical protein
MVANVGANGIACGNIKVRPLDIIEVIRFFYLSPREDSGKSLHSLDVDVYYSDIVVMSEIEISKSGDSD